MVGPILLLLVMVAAVVAATVSRDLFASVISLGLASATLGTFYFYLGLDYAGAFELSAGAGLITVMFVSILSMMSRRSRPGSEGHRFAGWARVLAGLAVLGIVAIIAVTLVTQPPQFATETSSQIADVPRWRLRTPDVIALGLLMLSGALGLSAMFHPEEGTRRG